MVVELWRVRSGRWESLDGDQHSWAERSGSVVGQAWGSGIGGLFGAYGAMVGALGTGSPDRDLDPLTWWSHAQSKWLAGAARGAGQAASLASQAMSGLFRRWSETASSVGGTYNEVMVTVPCCISNDPSGRLYAFVAAMYTDSPVALWGDRAMSCGYRKRLARIEAPAPSACRVWSLEGRSLLSMNVESTEADQDRGVSRTRDQLRRWMSLSLLGGLPERRMALSTMDRCWDEPTVRTAPVVAQLSTASDFIGGFPAPGTHAACHGIRFEGVTAKLTYPLHRQL
jgi:hypothetical protein